MTKDLINISQFIRLCGSPGEAIKQLNNAQYFLTLSDKESNKPAIADKLLRDNFDCQSVIGKEAIKYVVNYGLRYSLELSETAGRIAEIINRPVKQKGPEATKSPLDRI